MLLAKLEIHLKETTNLDREYGRLLSKDLARKLTELNKTNMLAFYPSVVNLYSVELIVEAIGNHYHRRGVSNRFDFQKVLDHFLNGQIRSSMPQLNDSITNITIKEISFCEASALMIYCYKQDDYLIPDSDPHDVMSSENNYNCAQYTYSGRFLPMIKLWCDIINNSNRTFTAQVLNPVTQTYSVRKDYEFQAFSQKRVNQEVQTLGSLNTIGFKPFNKYYKILVSDRTMIPVTIEPIVNALYDNNQLCSRTVYTLDLVDAMKCIQMDVDFFEKIGAVLKELKGSTLVVLVDIPNHFLKTKEHHVVETDAIQRETEDTSDSTPKIDIDFTNKMQEYNLLDIDDALDFPLKTQLMRSMVSKLDKLSESKSSVSEEDRNPIHMFNNMIYSVLRDMNVIIAYTDTMAYEENYAFDKFDRACKTLSITKIELSDAALTKEQLTMFGRGVGLAHFEINALLGNQDTSQYIFDCVDTLVEERVTADKESYVYSSLYAFRYLINNAFDYRFQMDSEGNEYFQKFKKKKEEMLKSLDSLDDEEKRSDLEKKFLSEYGGIMDSRVALNNSDFDDLGFFGQGRRRNEYDENKTGMIELEKMIGLKDIKEQIARFADFVELNKIKTSKELKPIPISKHMVFMGNPGTAKTSVAIQLSKILYNKGLIRTPELKQVSRDDLVGKYVGWTARLVKEAIESAKGGILFVDEAYSLSQNEAGSNSYGKEAIDTFVNYLDKADVRDSTIIIFAGYRDEMKKFTDSNPGLKSRIGFYFDFPDYTTDELIEIAKVQATNAEYTLEEGYLTKLREVIEKNRKRKDFGNGRFVRNIFEKSVLEQSARLARLKDKMQDLSFTKKELTTIKEEDFSTKGIDLTSSDRNVGFIQTVTTDKV